ncbi:olfactory receptor 1468-like [Leptodactylus fuscus]|uniref:olfactory receptor 1468-like n=1 Tax=Leptodactylus fuscus TaxID=238119 RepID=UPI003F4F05DB
MADPGTPCFKELLMRKPTPAKQFLKSRDLKILQVSLLISYLIEMQKNNVTTITLLGFPGLQRNKTVSFIFLFMIYLTTIGGNVAVLTLVSYSKKLHCPMYFFLTQLTISDIITASDIVPNMLHMVVNNGTSMMFSGCITQVFFFGSAEASECLLLTAMSYDRYLAICHPLNYTSIMNPMLCLKLILLSWILGFNVTLVQVIHLSQLQFCPSNVIDHFFCDFDPVLKLACSNIMKIKVISILMGFSIIVCPFMMVVISYIYIVHAILRIQSISGRRKVFSTCGSHLVVVSLFYGTLISTYLIPEKGNSAFLHKILPITYTVVTPLVNPVIYCLRNKDIKKAFKKMKSW